MVANVTGVQSPLNFLLNQVWFVIAVPKWWWCITQRFSGSAPSSGILENRKHDSSFWGTQLSRCPSPHLRTKKDPVSETSWYLFSRIPNDGKSKKKNTVTLYIHEWIKNTGGLLSTSSYLVCYLDSHSASCLFAAYVAGKLYYIHTDLYHVFSTNRESTVHGCTKVWIGKISTWLLSTSTAVHWHLLRDIWKSSWREQYDVDIADIHLYLLNGLCLPVGSGQRSWKASSWCDCSHSTRDIISSQMVL
jgi:hypothetical protein